MPIAGNRYISSGSTGNRGVKFQPDANTVLWLPGQDDAYSSTIRDRSGKGNNGTITGTTWVRNDKGIWVNNFDGNDYIDCGNNATLQITDNLTCIIWIKTPAVFSTNASAFGGSEVFLSKYTTASNNRGWALGLLNVEDGGALNNPHISVGDPADGTFEWTGYSTTDLIVSTYYNIAFTFAAGTAILYVNNVVKALTNQAGVPPISLFNSNQNVLVGARNAGTAALWLGRTGLVRIYNRVLSSTEIGGIYRGERNLFGV